jgi:hypothetical protein
MYEKQYNDGEGALLELSSSSPGPVFEAVLKHPYLNA